MRLTLLFIILASNFSYAQPRDTLKTLDKEGNILQIQFRDNGLLSNYLIHYEYDKKNKLTKEYTTDTLGNILSRIGLAPIIIYEYKTEKGKKTKTEYCYDKNMKPDVLDRSPFYHKVIHSYNSKNQVIERWGLSQSGDTKFRMAYAYNKQGLESQIKYLDADGNVEKQFFSIIELKYDAQKRLVSEENFNSLHQPYSDKNTPFKKEISYIDDIECITFYDATLEIMEQDKSLMCKEAPNFELYNTDGKMLSLSDFQEKTVVLYFWTSKFRGAKYLNPTLFPFFEKYKDKVDVIAIALEDPNTQDKWIKSVSETKLDWAINLSAFNYFKSKVALSYQLESVPIYFVINAEGMIVGSHLKNRIELEEVLNKLLK